MIRVILLDIDGVVIKRERYFSEKYAKDYDLDLGRVSEFFKGKFKECVVGKADLKEELPRFLKKWGWDGSTDDFLDYWFSSETQKSIEVLSLVDKIRAFGIECDLASNQEKYRAEYLLETVGLSQYFDESFFSSDLGVDKQSPQFFLKVIVALGVKPEEILLIDDEQKIIDTASSLGLNTHLYQNIEGFRKAVLPLIAN